VPPPLTLAATWYIEPGHEAPARAALARHAGFIRPELCDGSPHDDVVASALGRHPEDTASAPNAPFERLAPFLALRRTP
jgi:hypothetical protein